ncbi:MAG: hypothetical protein U1E76_00875 [Planctomycetota bacterium]
MKRFLQMATIAATVAAIAPSVMAEGRQMGSLLVFPVYSTMPGDATVLTVTNANLDTSFDNSIGLPKGTIDTEWIFINGANCGETNFIKRLTPGDSISLLANTVILQPTMGYVYIVARNPNTGAPVTFNYLSGLSTTFTSYLARSWEMPPFSFRGIPAEGQPTNLDGDSNRDLDGVEYEQVPDVFTFPMFWGQEPPDIHTCLILLGLTGTQFTTTVDFLILNDNEQQFSAEWSFPCYTMTDLIHISGAWLETFLDASNNNPNELQGASFKETGWYRIDGAVASSSNTTVFDPAFLCAQVQLLNHLADADLPFEEGHQANGSLLSRSIFGDTN